MLLLSSCSKKTPAAPPAGNITPTPIPAEEALTGYFPLKTGNTWEYEGKGMEYASYTQNIEYSKNNRCQLMLNNGATVTAAVMETNEDSVVCTHKENKVYDNRNLLDKPSNTNITILKTPLKKGTNWISEDNSEPITSKLKKYGIKK